MGVGTAATATAAATGTVAATIAGGALLAGGISSLAGLTRALVSHPEPPTPTKAPEMEDAAAKAKELVASRRRAQQLSGGQTILTGSSGAALTESQAATKTLLGQ